MVELERKVYRLLNACIFCVRFRLADGCRAVKKCIYGTSVLSVHLTRLKLVQLSCCVFGVEKWRQLLWKHCHAAPFDKRRLMIYRDSPGVRHVVERWQKRDFRGVSSSVDAVPSANGPLLFARPAPHRSSRSSQRCGEECRLCPGICHLHV
ncbi:hypothetical protein M514_03016 [Trichuris suis]|uniref:Uncharacterized protein n=1 Tax=Trichuris suis TaxID=68888 RepID=A0A085MG92_9BILA|nr:hypothetical protein M513_03016 [Trichuris suis]KFD69101.1 hypothetical protein M514_03016 [Trichuris suis]